MNYYTLHNPLTHIWSIVLPFHNIHPRIGYNRCCYKICTPPTRNYTIRTDCCSNNNQLNIDGMLSCRMNHRMQHTTGRHQCPNNIPTHIPNNQKHCKPNNPAYQNTTNMNHRSDNTHSGNSDKQLMMSIDNTLTWISCIMCMHHHSNSNHLSNSHIRMYSNSDCIHQCADGISHMCWCLMHNEDNTTNKHLLNN